MSRKEKQCTQAQADTSKSMNKQEAVLRYKTSMAVFKSWHRKGAISDTDLQTINVLLAERYNLSSSSIYFENDLLYRKK